MRRAPLSITILLAVLGAGAAAWWVGSADERRMSECREAGVESADRLARCAESAEASKAVLTELKDEQLAEFRGRVLKIIRARLIELRAGARSEVDKPRYERLSVEDLVETYNLNFLWMERSKVPIGIEKRRFAVEGRLQTAGSEWEELPEFNLRPLPSEVIRPESSTGDMSMLLGLTADIGDLKRNERKFAREICASIYFGLAYRVSGCPVIAYGQIVMESAFGDDFFVGNAVDFLKPVFQIEAMEFLDPSSP